MTSPSKPTPSGQQVSERYRALYQDFYSHQDLEWRSLSAAQKFENIKRLTRDVPHQTVLEIGAGDGAISALMCADRYCASLHVLDISETGIELLKARELEVVERAETFDGATLPYPDQRFELVILSHVVEHLEHPRQLLYEAARVGRAVFIEVPLEDTRGLSPVYVPDHVGHINVYSPRSIRHLIQTCGLSIQREHVHPASLTVHRHSSGRKGVIKYLTKRLALTYLPQWAPNLFTYHAAFLATPKA